MYISKAIGVAIDHRTWNTGLPVRSAILKPCAGRLVVGWVTTSEYLLLIVFAFWGEGAMDRAKRLLRLSMQYFQFSKSPLSSKSSYLIPM
jgi:hypothetical protein